MYSDIIGILGGMGTYATIDFFHKLVAAFPAEKEWDRPRIVIDNNCTMPSRVVAVLEGGETRTRLSNELAKSIKGLINSGCTKIVLACNTSHVFLPDIFDLLSTTLNENPQCEILNIIDNLGFYLQRKAVRTVYLLASEGTIISRIYQDTFEKYGIEVLTPETETEFKQLRYFIEAVKQNKITPIIIDEFVDFICSCNNSNIILGCTEFPILYNYAVKYLEKSAINVYDPLEYIIKKIKEEII